MLRERRPFAAVLEWSNDIRLRGLAFDLHTRRADRHAGRSEIAEAVVSVLDGRAPPGLGAAARAFVVKNHEWAANLGKLDALMVR